MCVHILYLHMRIIHAYIHKYIRTYIHTYVQIQIEVLYLYWCDLWPCGYFSRWPVKCMVQQSEISKHKQQMHTNNNQKSTNTYNQQSEINKHIQPTIRNQQTQTKLTHIVCLDCKFDGCVYKPWGDMDGEISSEVKPD